MILSGLDDRFPPADERLIRCEQYRCESAAQYVIEYYVPLRDEEKYCYRHFCQRLVEVLEIHKRIRITESENFPGMKEVRI